MQSTTKATLALFALAATATSSGAQTAGQTAAHPADHRQYTPGQVQWSPGPPSLPRGAEAALLYGDPAKEGPFVLRLRFPANYQIAPHRHPGAEILTVISGTFVLGSGEAVDRSKATPLPAGSFIAMSPNMPHSAHTEEVTVVQLNSIGPWSITYVNPGDDPRRQPQ